MIPPELFKSLSSGAQKILLRAINVILAGGEVPLSWKGALVVLLFKKEPAAEMSATHLPDAHNHQAGDGHHH
jgi:hypothetical protein